MPAAGLLAWELPLSPIKAGWSKGVDVFRGRGDDVTVSQCEEGRGRP